MGEKEKQNDSCAVEGGDTEEVRTRRNRLIWVTCLSPWAKVMSWIRPWSVLLLQMGSVLTSMTHVAIKGTRMHVVCCLKAVLLLEQF